MRISPETLYRKLDDADMRNINAQRNDLGRVNTIKNRLRCTLREAIDLNKYMLERK